MSLSKKQLEDTSRELKDNLYKSGLSIDKVSDDLGTTPDYIEHLLELNPRKIEDTWILKNYLVEKVKEAGKQPTKFTAIGGNYKIIWFLDRKYIDGKKIY